MKEHKMLDLFYASNEEAKAVVLSELLPAVVEEYGECIVGEGVALLVGDVIGAVCPRINNIRLGYKQNRLERNMKKTFSELSRRQIEIEDRLQLLERHHKEYLDNVTEMLLDNIVDEIQENKVKYNVNGYINLINSDNSNDDFALMFFMTLSQLSELDISVLKVYSCNSQESVKDIMAKLNISYEQIRLVKEKLERFGLLQSKNEEINDNNMELMVKYLLEVEKERKKSKPKEVRVPNLKKVALSDTYKITSLGRQFLQLVLTE